MTPNLHIYLLGDFRLSCGDEPCVAIQQARHQVLLTYLLLHRHAPQARRHLAFLLWPDSSEPQALTNLRKALTHLRQMAPILTQSIYADHQVVQWRPAVAFTLDVADFETKLDQATAAEQAGRVREALALWSAAVGLYRGPLTPGCYDDWVIAERERLHQLCLGALERLVAGYERQQEPAAAIPYAQQLLRLDPLQETMYLQLMRLQALLGDRAGALRTYHTCATVLMRELEVEPAPETQEAYARLLKLETGVKATTRVHSATRLVGRQVEWEKLQRTWRLITKQSAHFVCIWGEAGIGKTHLAEELLSWASQQGFTLARTRAYAGEGQLAYAPVVEWLRAEAVYAVRQRVAPVWLSEVARLAPEILSEQPTVSTPASMTEPWQRQRLWEALARALLAAPQPMLLVIDDLQWCDTETLEWLRYLLHYAPQARLLVLGTARPEEVDGAHPLQTLCRHLRTAEQLTELELGPLNAEQSALLAAQVAQQPMEAQAQEVLYHATAGNPLFIVEMVRAKAQEGVGDWHSEGPTMPHVATPAVPLPPKIQAVIQNRLAYLSPSARNLAQVAAVVGQDFAFELLLHASGQDEEMVARGLDELWQRRIIREHGDYTYDFSHDRIRDVAYGEISPIRRRQLHRYVAQALEVLYAEALDNVASQLAIHYYQAGVTTQAIIYYQRAADVAVRCFAYTDADAYLDKGLALLDTLPKTLEYNEQRIDALLLKGQMLLILKGLTAPEVEVVYGQANALCRDSRQSHKRYLALRCLWLYWSQRSEWQKVVLLEEELLRLAQQMAEPLYLRSAFWVIGVALFHKGQLVAASDYFWRAVAPSAGQSPVNAAFQMTDHRVAIELYRLSYALWLLGYPEQAQSYMDQTLAQARSLAQPHNLLMKLCFALCLAHDLRQRQVMQSLFTEYMALLEKYPFPELVAHAKIYEGWFLAQDGDHAIGIDLLKQGLTTWYNMGIFQFITYFRAWLVEAYQQAKQFEQGLDLLAEIFALSEEIGEQFWSAELYRLKGELLLAQGCSGVESEVCFQQALQIARQQQAKSLELRVAMCLARLWQQQERVAEAYQLLAEIYGWFTEGFDTADLVEAKQLLAELKHNRADTEPFSI